LSSESYNAMASALPDRQLFRSLFHAVARNTNNNASILADSHHQCAYSEIPERLDEIQRFLTESSVNGGDCITLEINNSVRAALSVLALLDAGYSFMTLPVPGQGARAGGNAVAAAAFSRWILTVSADKPANGISLSAPATYLSIEPNPHFDPASRIPSDDDPRLFFRTSGSLGTAKLAAFSYRPFFKNVLNALERRGFDPSHRLALPTPIFHSYGLGAGLLPALAGGASIDLQARSNILKYLEREEVFEPNVAYVTPAFCETLIRGRRSGRFYEFMVTSGDRISESAFRRCEDLHGPLVNQYGTTEMGMVSASELHMPYDLRCRTVGRPVDGVEYRITEIPAGEGTEGTAGELQIRHAYGFDGYVDLKGNTLVPPNAFDGDWYRTGDLATMGPEGTLVVLGRCDLSVNRDGVLLPLAEVESRMRELEGVDEVAVAPGPAGIRGRGLLAFCVMSPKLEVTGQQLRATYATKAPRYSVPDTVHLLSALPKLESGKVDRQALAKLAQEIVQAGAAD